MVLYMKYIYIIYLIEVEIRANCLIAVELIKECLKSKGINLMST